MKTSFIFVIFLLAACSAAQTHTETHDNIDLRFYDLVESILKRKFHTNDETKTKTLEILKNSGIIEEIYDPELLDDEEKLEKKLRTFITGDGNETEVTASTSTSTPKVQKIVIKNDTTKEFNVISMFTLQFFIGLVFGLLLGLPIGAGTVMFLKRGKTYNYAINKPKPPA